MSEKRPDERMQIYTKLNGPLAKAFTNYRRSLDTIPAPSTAVRRIMQEHLTELGFFPPPD